MKALLIIEDNRQNYYMMKYLLEKGGFRVAGAADGAAGIRMAGEMRPDGILLDIQLPGMDGYAVAEELKKDEALRGIPLVAVTSYAMAGDRERILAAGADGYIEKPIDPNTFVATVREYIQGRTAGEGQCLPEYS